MKGFRFIEVISQCPTAFGRKAGFKDAGEMLKWFKDKAIPAERAKKLSEEECAGRIVIGEFAQRQRPTLVQSIYETIEEAQQQDED
jgi:2-oxoglutarate ferredoxin oxidoreductase subunit beta